MNEDIFETPSSTPDFRTELARQLAELVPETIADGKVDVAKLKELLDDDVADTNERFGLFWPGKKQALRAAQEPTTATLVPDKENSKNWDTTENIFIEGDNLEVLKILQKHYHGKIKMIYIDPPYNTGKDFVYPDNYKEGLQSYLEFTGQIDGDGRKLKSNSDSDGRYHSNWLNMMYPRLKLARNLLKEDGVIFISIDDSEVGNLRKLADEVFGENSFVGQIAWKKKTNGNNVGAIPSVHDHILVYARSSAAEIDLAYPVDEESLSKRFSNPDNDPRGPWDTMDLSANHEGPYFPIINPVNGDVHYPPEGRYWVFNADEVGARIKDGRIVFGKSGQAKPVQKVFMSDRRHVGKRAESWWDSHGMNSDATEEMRELFGIAKVFTHPKPSVLLKHIVDISTDSDSIVLDFFAGSGTTSHAVMELNAKDSGSRRTISVQLPEPTPEGSSARNAGFHTISEISRRRIDLAGDKIAAELDAQLGEREVPLDIGFRAYRLADTNFAKWRVSSSVGEGELQQHLLNLRESAADDASPEALLTEVLLKQGYSLTEQVSSQQIEGLDVLVVGDNLVAAYMNEHVKPTLEQLRALVDSGPAKIIVLEDAFDGDDELKTNLAQLCKVKDITLWTA